jgi:outer membrane protein assembly factor BamB
MRCFVFRSLALLCILHCSLAAAENWPRFRGADGAGISDSANIPSRWSEQDYRWVAELPGSGNSSPVIWQDRLFVTTADEKSLRRFLICLNTADGAERWRAESTFSKHKKHKNNSFASSTPAVDESHVYQLWHSNEQTSLIAYDHDGAEVWRYELGPYLHGQGGATSPIVAGDLVVVAHDHKADSFLMAVDRMTGDLRWKIPREGKRACYSTPCTRTTADGKQELVFVHCYEGVIGVDPESGKQTWHIDPFGRESQRALASPIIAGNLVIAGSGAVGGDRQIVAVAIEGDGDKAKAREVYRLVRQSPHVPTPLAIGDRLYLWNDGGIATCCELQTGDVVWQKRVGGSYFASPIAIGNRIFSIDTAGEVVVLAAEDTFRMIARNPMGEGSRATLACSGNVLYVRTDSKVFAIPGQ